MSIQVQYNPIADKLLQNVMIAQKAYDDVNQQYLTTIQDSGNWDIYADSDESRRLIGELQAQLDNASADFAKNGYKATSLKDYAELKRKINTVINPRMIAYQKREELDKEWRQKHGTDSTYIGSRPANLSLAEIMNGDYGYGVSGADIEKDATHTAIAMSQRMYRDLPAINLGQYIKTGSLEGYTPEEVEQILNFEHNAFAPITLELQKKYGYDKLTPEEQELFNDYILSGYRKGLQSDVKTDYRLNHDYAGRSSSNSNNNPNINDTIPYIETYQGENYSKEKEYYDERLKLIEEIQGIKTLYDNEGKDFWKRNKREKSVYTTAYTNSSGTFTHEVPAQTYKEYLNELKKKYGDDMPFAVSSEGDIVFGNDDFIEKKYNELMQKRDETIAVYRDLSMNQVDNNVGIGKALNNRIGSGNIKMVNEKGKEIENFTFDSKKPLYINLKSDGKLEFKQTDENGENAVVAYNDGSILEHGAIYTDRFGKTKVYTPNDILKRMKYIKEHLKDYPLESSTQEDRTDVANEYKFLQEQVMMSLYYTGNSQAKEQSGTDSKL